MLKSIIPTILMFSTLALAETTFDKKEILNGVTVQSGKVDSVRTFSGKTEKTFPFPIELVKKGITNFSEKCNNDYKEKRTYTSQEQDCKYHNEHLVETVVINDIRKMDYFKNLSEAFVLAKRVYNRGSFGYYELVTVDEQLNEKKQKTVRIIVRMLDDKEVKLFTEPKFRRESAFKTSNITFNLTAVSQNETHLSYEYEAETDHWLLNKEISVPQVFASISKSVNELLETVETESSLQKRALASKE